MRKPLIGINPYFFHHNDTNWNGTKERYYQSVARGGGIPVTLHYPTKEHSVAEIAAHLDGLMMVGGDDLAPDLYGSKNTELVLKPYITSERERFDRAIFESMLEAGKPVLAICVGMQHINVILGGDLIEDINTLMPNHIDHGVFNGPWAEHEVTLYNDSQIAKIMGTINPTVASTHHQGIRSLGNGLKAEGESADGLIEAITLQDYPDQVIAVQWHPELLNDRPEQIALFKWLSNRAKTNKLKRTL